MVLTLKIQGYHFENAWIWLCKLKTSTLKRFFNDNEVATYFHLVGLSHE